VSLRDLRTKIKSIGSTRKITAAMQLVAVSKMQKATNRALSSRPFTDLVSHIIERIAHDVEASAHPLFTTRPVKNVLLVLFTTNRGLAGSLNTQLLRMFSRWDKEQTKLGRSVKVVAVGAKGRTYLARYHRDQLVADFATPESIPDYNQARPIYHLAQEEFVAGRADEVYLGFNQFVSTLVQQPTIEPFLPFSIIETHKSEQEVAREPEIMFEPDQAAILNSLIPRFLGASLYQVLLETYASEQSARMIAMKNATDNAGDLIEDLELTYNGLRQSAITGELLDIASGAAALEN